MTQPNGPVQNPLDMVLQIRAGDAQEILNYLTKQPYADVYKFVATLMTLKQVQPTVVTVEPAPPAADTAAQPPPAAAK